MSASVEDHLSHILLSQLSGEFAVFAFLVLLASELIRFFSLDRVTSSFIVLNQDLPEYFEDHMGEWMGGFAKLLEYKNVSLVDEDEEMVPGEESHCFS